MNDHPSTYAQTVADSLSRSSIKEIADYLEMSARYAKDSGAKQIEIDCLRAAANNLEAILTWQTEA